MYIDEDGSSLFSTLTGMDDMHIRDCIYQDAIRNSIDDFDFARSTPEKTRSRFFIQDDNKLSMRPFVTETEAFQKITGANSCVSSIPTTPPRLSHDHQRRMIQNKMRAKAFHTGRLIMKSIADYVLYVRNRIYLNTNKSLRTHTHKAYDLESVDTQKQKHHDIVAMSCA